MKKALVITAIVLVVLIGGTYGVYKVLDRTGEPKKVLNQVAPAEDTDPSAKNQKELDKQQTAKIGGIQYNIGINEDSSQDAVIDVMHKMTHQKVKAEEKWGAIPMIPDTIRQVYEIVSKSNFEQKDDLLAILEKWKNGQFDEVDRDHNYFWDYQGGTIGKAYGILNKSEEETFILNNFGEDFAKK